MSEPRARAAGEPGGPGGREPRVRPGRLREVGPLIWAFSRIAGRVTRTRPPALFLTLGRNRRLFWGWLHFAGRLMPGGTLPRREVELVILRVAHLRACAYEFSHHRRLGRRFGISADDVERVVAGPGAEGFSDRERALLCAVDELAERQDLDEEAWGRLRRHLDEPQAVEFLLLVGHYQMLATTINTLRLEPDASAKGDASGR